MRGYIAKLKRQVIQWLLTVGVKAIAIIKISSRSVSYLTESGKTGSCFIPALVWKGQGDYEVPEYETFRYSDRLMFMIRNLKTSGKGDRTSVICNLYIGMHNRLDAYDLGNELGFREKFNRTVRDPKRISGYRNELVVRGDFDIKSFQAIAQIIDRLERRNPFSY